MDPFPPPTGDAPLLLSVRIQWKTVLIIGGDALAASRAYTSLEADAQVLCKELRWRAQQGQLTVLNWAELSSKSDSDEHIVPANKARADFDIGRDIAALDVYLAGTHSISLVCVTGTLSTFTSSSLSTNDEFLHPTSLEYVELAAYPLTSPTCPRYAIFSLLLHIVSWIRLPERKARCNLLSPPMEKVVVLPARYEEKPLQRFLVKLVVQWYVLVSSDGWHVNKKRSWKRKWHSLGYRRRN